MFVKEDLFFSECLHRFVCVNRCYSGTALQISLYKLCSYNKDDLILFDFKLLQEIGPIMNKC